MGGVHRPDQLLLNLQERAALLASRKEPVCRAMFADAYRSGDEDAKFRYVPERCSRISTRPARRRTSQSPQAPQAPRGLADVSMIREDLRLINETLKGVVIVPISRDVWSSALDVDAHPSSHHRFVQLAAGGGCIMNTFPRMIAPALRRSRPDPLERARFLVTTWNGRLLSRPSVSVELRNALVIELMRMARAHCVALLRGR